MRAGDLRDAEITLFYGKSGTAWERRKAGTGLARFYRRTDALRAQEVLNGAVKDDGNFVEAWIVDSREVCMALLSERNRRKKIGRYRFVGQATPLPG